MTESTVTQGWLELDRDCRRARDPMKVKVDRCKGDRKGNVGKLICPCWKATPLCEQINFLENSDRILSIRPLASPPPFFPTTAFVSVRFSRRRALVWRRRHLVFFSRKPKREMVSPPISRGARVVNCIKRVQSWCS